MSFLAKKSLVFKAKNIMPKLQTPWSEFEDGQTTSFALGFGDWHHQSSFFPFAACRSTWHLQQFKGTGVKTDWF